MFHSAEEAEAFREKQSDSGDLIIERIGAPQIRAIADLLLSYVRAFGASYPDKRFLIDRLKSIAAELERQ